MLGVDPQQAGREWRERVGIVLQGAVIEPYLKVRGVLQRDAGYYPRPHSRRCARARGPRRQGGRTRERIVRWPAAPARRRARHHRRTRLLFLDEPTTGFDPSARRGAWELVEKLKGEGATIILTTHYTDEAQHLADRVVVINRGEIVAAGTPETIGGRAKAARASGSRSHPGSRAPELAVPLERDGTGFTVETRDEVPAPHALTSWALDSEVELIGLTVDRPSLEDVYIELTSTETAQ